MSLTDIKKLQKEKGFTIVELLIVIVVIAILAAIVLVAYNGIQNNARDTQNQTDAVSLVKIAEAVNADTGSYPTGTDDATLLTSFNSSDTTQVPTGIAIKYLATGGTAPDFSTAESDANLATRTYTVEVCGATNGVVIYYPQRSDNSVQTAVAGPGC